MVGDEHVIVQLNTIKNITNSDILAFAMLDAEKRKLSWHHLIGARCSRTFKIKQSATAGLTAQALRTGKAQQLSLTTEHERFCFGEAIMVTEQLSHVYLWPIIYYNFTYQGVIIVGKKQNEPFDNIQIEQAQQHVNEFERQMSTNTLFI